MFPNGRKTIGLFIFNPQGGFQEEICRGMAKKAEQLGYNLAVFTCFGSYGSVDSRYDAGEMMICELPQYDKLAGIVLVPDTFSVEGAYERIMEKIREKASCPVVSLRERIDGVSNVLIDESKSMEDITRHIIEVHGKTDIAFMTGPEGREDSEGRLTSFKRVMEEYGYPVPEHRVFYGDFWRRKAPDACDWFFSEGKYPEAIMCANDFMGLAVIDELYRRGIRVPDDIIVTGYDGMREGILYSPALSTVQIDFGNMACKAVELIDRHQNDDEVEILYANSEVIPRASCGCQDADDITAVAITRATHKAEAGRDNLDLQFSFLTIDLSRVRMIDDMHDVLSKYVYNIEEVQDYFVCFRDDIEGKEDSLYGYTDQMRVRVAIRNRENLGTVNIPFPQQELLPKQFVDDGPQCFFFFPLHYLSDSFGYEVFRFGGDGKYAKTHVRWNIAVSNAIYNIRFSIKMNDLVFELENMYIQDVLTGLYNRRGFEKYARMQFSQARASDSMVCVIGIDMDGLKPINDIYGHNEGDSALRAVGYAITEAGVTGQIGARIGGDEFEVFFPCQDEKDAENWIALFQQSLDHFNEKSDKPYEVHASLGYKVGIPTADDTIATYMKTADDLMYKNKIINKRQRNEGLR